MMYIYTHTHTGTYINVCVRVRVCVCTHEEWHKIHNNEIHVYSKLNAKYERAVLTRAQTQTHSHANTLNK